MPELPDIVVYLEALGPRVVGRPLQALRIPSPFLLRTVDPPVADVTGRVVQELRRLGKRIAFRLDDDYFIVLHLMIAGRLRWQPHAAAIPRRYGLAAFDFPNGTLLLTEASKQQRASIHLARGARALAALDRGGLEVLEADLSARSEERRVGKECRSRWSPYH